MRRTKTLISLILSLAILTLCLCATGCNRKKYKPVESTAEEARAVYTLTIGEQSYTVRYELYRALFLNLKSDFDGGDPTVWEGEDKEEYLNAINAAILDRICEIYSAFALCDELGIDLYSGSVEDTIYSYIEAGVEGGEGVVGYGSYEEYLAALKKMNLNYSVQELMYRYSVAIDLIDEYYIGTFDAESITDSISIGKLTYTREDVESFYFSEDCVRVLRVSIDPSNYYEDQVEDKINRIHSLICEAAQQGERQVAIAMINNTTTPGPEVEQGVIIARHNLDRAYFGQMTDAAFALSEGEVSAPILVFDGSEAYYIMYRAEKSAENFSQSYSDIAMVFLRDIVGGYLDERAEELVAGAVAEPLLSELDPSSISME